eukprot:scaffold284300_cov30-Tisochrysis_lutea.AAC.2
MHIALAVFHRLCCRRGVPRLENARAESLQRSARHCAYSRRPHRRSAPRAQDGETERRCCPSP